MFYLIGLGLGDTKDITLKGLEIVKQSKRVYLESYTSILTVGKDALEEFFGKELILADRDMVESNADEMLEGADTDNVAFLVVGDPFGATTHTDLVLRILEKGLQYRVIHNASIMNAVGCCGLQLYHFGATVSIPFWTDTWKPDSFYDKIALNKVNGMHTLCLLDIKVKEQTIENMMKGNKIYEPPRYMSVSQATEQLLEIIDKRQKDGQTTAFSGDSVCVGLARIGTDTQEILATTLQDMRTVDLGDPLHSLVIPGFMHPFEMDMLRTFAKSEHVKELLKT